MKKLLTFLVALLLSCRLIAQDAPQMFTVRESVVRPSKDGAYREAMKKLRHAAEQHKLMVAWNFFALQDNSYIFTRPITSLGW